MGPSKRKGSVRRQVLDLNARENSPSRPTWQTKYQNALTGENIHQNGDFQSSSPTTKSNPLSGLLGNYNSDSDSEDQVQKPPATSLDAKVEDFLKEIQSISADTKTVATEQTTPQSQTQEEALYPPSVTAWQQCYDHNSGYPYYWNTETNEVTWEMPPDLKAAIEKVAMKQQALQHKKEKPPQPAPQPKVEVKKKVCKYPWQTESDSEDEKIEMITSFGPQSGDESEGEERKPEKSKKKTLTSKSLPSCINSSKISLAPEDLEGMNENSYETSSLLTHGVQDTGPPGDEGFQQQKEAVKTKKVPVPSKKEEPVAVLPQVDRSISQIPVESVPAQSKPVEVVSANLQDTPKNKDESTSDSKPFIESTNFADDVIAQIENETPPDYTEVAKAVEPQTFENQDPSSPNSKTSSFALIANYGDDSEPEDNSLSEKRKSSKSVMHSKPLFPIEIPQEKVKPLFPCMNSEIPKIESFSKELAPPPPPSDPEPISNLYNTELDISDPVAQKAFKRKKRIEFATTVYGPSTSKAKPASPERVVSAPSTQYNLDPESNSHQGFGFNPLRNQGDTEKKTFKSYGGIQFIKAETINLSAESESKAKLETESDGLGAPKISSKEEVKNEEIEDAAGLLREKMTFLSGGADKVSPIQQMAIELETLVLAWQDGALNPPYLLRWLNEKCGELIRHEKTAAPPGWTCLWDRKSKRYYYRNSSTKAIQWEYPNVEEKVKTKNGDVEGGGDEMDICDTPPHISPAGPEKQTDEPPPTPPPPVISNTPENDSPPSPTPQPPPPPQISFRPENESSSAKVAKKKKRKAEEMANSEVSDDVETVPAPEKPAEEAEPDPPLPPMPPPPPPPPDEPPPPLPDSPPPPLPLDPDQPLPPGVDEPEYSVYRVQKQAYKKSQADSAQYSTELMMTYGYGLPVQQVVSPSGAAMTMPMQPLEYHTYIHEPVSNHYLVQSAPASHVIHCPAKKPKPSLNSELVSFYSDLAMLDTTPAETSTPPAPPPPKEPTPAPPLPVVTTSTTSTTSSVASVSKPTESVTSNGVNVKKKKKAKATASGLSLKKKGVSSLVAKWQQVQQEVRKDFSDDEDDVTK